MSKPQEIIELEEELGFELRETSYPYDNALGKELKKSYSLNSNREVVALNLYGCNIQHIKFLKNFSSLRELDLHNNQISNISNVQILEKLNRLNLRDNQISNISPLCNLINLEKLYLGNNQISKLSCLKKLIYLKQLDLSNNQMFNYASLKRLENLTWLNLNNNKISDYSFLKTLRNLKTLYLWNNNISYASGLKGLESLEELNLGNNQILVTSFLQNLTELQTLNLNNNQIFNISLPFLNRFPKLGYLNLYQNPIRNIPKHIFNKSIGSVLTEVRNYLEALEEDGKINNDQIKMLLLGNSTAGKTSLINFLKEGEYVQKRVSTHGIENLIWQPFKDEENETEVIRNIKVSVWDFGGQEFYHNTHSLFFSDNAIYLVLFEEKTNHQGKKDTLINLYENGIQVEKEVELEHFEYSYWLDNVKYLTQTQDETCLLIQNKCDINDAVSVDDMTKQNYGLNPENERIFYISVEKAFEKDKKFLLKFEMFKAELLEHIKKNIATFDNSKKWQEIKNQIQTNWKDDKVLDYSEYVRHCQEIKSSIDDRKEGQTESQLDTLTKIMREQGIVLRYKNIPQLKDKIFVNPAWLTDCIYKVLDYSVIKSEGKFDRTHLEKISQTIQPQISADELLALLKNFNLIFEIERMGKQWFICPQFLPSEIKGEGLYSVESHRENKQIKYSFTLSYPKFLPVSTFLKFLAQHGKNHIHYWYSKNELLFIENNKAVDAKCIRTKEERSITINVQDKDLETSQKLFEELLNIDFPSDLRVSVNEGNDFVEVRKLKNKIKEEPHATQIESIENKSLNIQDFWFLFGKAESKAVDYTKNEEKQGIQEALKLLIERKNFYDLELRKAADAGIRFSLTKQIEDLENEIEKYRKKL